MVALTIIGAASAYGYVNWRFGQIHTKHLSALTTKGPDSAGSGGGKAFTLLVVGSDSRAALDANGDASQFGNSAVGLRSALGHHHPGAGGAEDPAADDAVHPP